MTRRAASHRVIDKRDSVDRGDVLEAMRDCFETSHGALMASGATAISSPNGNRREHVAGVVPAASPTSPEADESSSRHGTHRHAGHGSRLSAIPAVTNARRHGAALAAIENTARAGWRREPGTDGVLVVQKQPTTGGPARKRRRGA